MEPSGNPSEELKVFISTRESTCDECGDNLGSRAWITLFDRFLSKGFEWREARAIVQPKIERLLQQWERR